MFDAPEAKRRKRSELYKDDITETDNQEQPPIDQHNNETNDKLPYTFDYELISPILPTSPPVPPPEPDSNTTEPETTQFEFRLFQTPTKPNLPSEPTNQLITISLRSPSPSANSTSSGRFIKPTRPASYYFTSALSATELSNLQSQYNHAAISASTLSTLSSMPWPGTSLPWKLISIPSSTISSQQPKSHNASTATEPGKRMKRTKPSKKRRILLRQHLARRKELAAKTVDAEAAEREKRTRRNREKKVKRKAREKRKKLGEDDGNGAGSIQEKSDGE